MDDPAFAFTVLDTITQELLLAASEHDIDKLNSIYSSNISLVREYNINITNLPDSDTGFTPLHAAIAACETDDGLSGEGSESQDELKIIESAMKTVVWLFENGAQWSILDEKKRTPGCIALELGDRGQCLYELCVEAGERSELFMGVMNQKGWALLGEDSGAESDIDDLEDDLNSSHTLTDFNVQPASELHCAAEEPLTNELYLEQDLAACSDRLLDSQSNAVMMSWESSIMHQTAQKLLPEPGLRILNIGFGMGIFDSYVQSSCNPQEHHIIEAHPTVLHSMRKKGWYDKSGVTIHEGKWQDVIPQLFEQSLTFDAIFYDTFAESYSDFREFFRDHVVQIIEQVEREGRWSFFNGMGADRQISYDVYQRVADHELREEGFNVEWEETDVPREIFEDEAWSDVKRSYYRVAKYRIPLVTYG